jgi:hypothetical protein
LVAAQTGAIERRAITVRIYNNFWVRSGELQVAQGQAEAILRGAGIDILWTNCWFRDHAPADAPAACLQAPAGNDLVLRLQGGTPTGAARSLSSVIDARDSESCLRLSPKKRRARPKSRILARPSGVTRLSL